MSIESEILRIQHNVANAYAAVSEKGGEVPLQPTSGNLAAAVASIPAGSGGEVYSTEEQRIGTWIDGTALYRRVYVKKATTTGNVTLFTLDSDYVPKMYEVYLTKTDGQTISGNISVSTSDQFHAWIYRESGNVAVRIAGSSYVNCLITFVIYYTKTNDVTPGSYKSIYSAEEAEIGTWIDGKPLYRKVLSLTTGANDGAQVIGTVGTDAQVQMYHTYFENTLAKTVMAGNVNLATGYILYTSIDNVTGDITCYTNNSSYRNKPIVIVVEYTKTTDQAGEG